MAKFVVINSEDDIQIVEANHVGDIQGSTMQVAQAHTVIKVGLKLTDTGEESLNVELIKSRTL